MSPSAELKVLIVDDEQTIRSTLAEIVSDMGLSHL